MLNSIFKQIRITQLVKNLFVFIPILVSGSFFDIANFSNSLTAFFIFSITSSIVYVMNDIKDLKSDQKHPKKCKRPLAKGDISTSTAYLILLVLIIINISLNIYYSEIVTVIITYLIINVFYTFHLKKIPIIDVTCISFGFVLRVLAGIIATSLIISPWIISLTFFLSLVLSFGKRNAELSILELDTRESIKKYNLQFLTNAIYLISSIVITIYLLYTIDVKNFTGNVNLLYFSNIPVIIGILTYCLLISKNDEETEDPSLLIFKNGIIGCSVIAWAIIITSSFYV